MVARDLTNMTSFSGKVSTRARARMSSCRNPRQVRQSVRREAGSATSSLDLPETTHAPRTPVSRPATSPFYSGVREWPDIDVTDVCRLHGLKCCSTCSRNEIVQSTRNALRDDASKAQHPIGFRTRSSARDHSLLAVFAVTAGHCRFTSLRRSESVETGENASDIRYLRVPSCARQRIWNSPDTGTRKTDPPRPERSRRARGERVRRKQIPRPEEIGRQTRRASAPRVEQAHDPLRALALSQTRRLVTVVNGARGVVQRLFPWVAASLAMAPAHFHLEAR